MTSTTTSNPKPWSLDRWGTVSDAAGRIVYPWENRQAEEIKDIQRQRFNLQMKINDLLCYD